MLLQMLLCFADGRRQQGGYTALQFGREIGMGKMGMGFNHHQRLLLRLVTGPSLLVDSLD